MLECLARQLSLALPYSAKSAPSQTAINRGYFYFFWTYACPSPNALSPTFEWMFARMEPLRDGTFALYAMRYTGKEWVGVLDALSVDECMKAIQEDEWFAF